jgi:hypothetical protein
MLLRSRGNSFNFDANSAGHRFEPVCTVSRSLCRQWHFEPGVVLPVTGEGPMTRSTAKPPRAIVGLPRLRVKGLHDVPAKASRPWLLRHVTQDHLRTIVLESP